MKIAVVDYGSGNLRSAAKAFERQAGAGHVVEITADPDKVRKADRIVLPGQGAFADCAAGLRDMALALEDIRHPRAAELREQADAFMNDLRTAIRRMTELAPVTRLRDGTYSPYVPTRLYQRFRYFGPLRVEYFSRYNLPDARPCYRLSATREVLYGPMSL